MSKLSVVFTPMSTHLIVAQVNNILLITNHIHFILLRKHLKLRMQFC